jgi:hypothetical protein
MANVYAVVNNGNWSNPATWFGGISPTPADDVFSNGLTVNVDVTATVLSLRNTAAAPIVAGGTFNFGTSGVTLNATSIIPAAVASSLITVTHTTGLVTMNIVNGFGGPTINNFSTILYTGNGNLTITCPLITGNRANASSAHGITKTSSGTLTINGNVGAGQGIGNHGINSSSGNTAIVGDVIGLTQLNGSPTNAIFQASGNISIVGNVTGNTVGNHPSNRIIEHSGGDLAINGNIIGGTLIAPTISKTGGAITVTGNVTGNVTAAIAGTPTSVTVVGDVIGTGNHGIVITGTNTTLITGAITPSSTANAISSQGLVRVNTPLVNVNNWQAVSAPRITIEPTTTSITFQKIGGGNQVMLLGTANNANLPAVGDVRLGTTFGVSNEFTGTMAVQIPANVSQGALVDDNKVGTFLMTPASFVQELGVSTIPVAVRLQNSATVITTGTQLASFNI